MTNFTIVFSVRDRSTAITWRCAIVTDRTLDGAIAAIVAAILRRDVRVWGDDARWAEAMTATDESWVLALARRDPDHPPTELALTLDREHVREFVAPAHALRHARRLVGTSDVFHVSRGESHRSIRVRARRGDRQLARQRRPVALRRAPRGRRRVGGLRLTDRRAGYSNRRPSRVPGIVKPGSAFNT